MEISRSLHSRYNPAGEAERYLGTLNLKADICFFILIEPGMGYLVASLRKKNPNARIITLYAREAPASVPKENQGDSFWFPGAGISLRFFLEREIPDIQARMIKIIEWRPALAVYGDAYRFLLSETVEFIKQADASARTGNQFGRKWFRNFFRNLNLLSKVLYPDHFSFPVLLTGAGPGLEETIPLIRKERENIFLLAVSSSVAALKARDLEPDLIISTDGGGWALLHLYECVRGGKTINLAFSMNAAIPSQCGDSPLLVMSDGSLWQTLLLKETGVPFAVLPQRGTVSAAALDLALALTSGKIFFSGVDLSHKDIQTHVRPYSFDRLWNEKAQRINPLYSQVFGRSGLIHAGGSYNIYASWFSRHMEFYPKRLFSLGPNNQVFMALETSSLGLGRKKMPRPGFNIFSFTPAKKPAMRAARFLKAALSSSEYGDKLQEELAPILLPETLPSREELEEAVDTITKPYW